MTLLVAHDGLRLKLDKSGPKLLASNIEVGTFVVLDTKDSRQMVGQLHSEDGLVIWENGEIELVDVTKLRLAEDYHPRERLSEATVKLDNALAELTEKSALALNVGDYVISKPGSKLIGRVVFKIGSMTWVMWEDGKLDKFKGKPKVIKAIGFTEDRIAIAKKKIDDLVFKVKATTGFPYSDNDLWRTELDEKVIPDGSRKGEKTFPAIATAEILMQQTLSPYTIRLTKKCDGTCHAVFVNETCITKGISLAEAESLYKETVSSVQRIIDGEFDVETKYAKRRGALIKSKEGYDPEKVPDKILNDDHRFCHMVYANLKAGKTFGDWTIKDTIDIHNRIIKEMEARGFEHETPLPPTKSRSMIDEAYLKVLSIEEALRSPAVIGTGPGISESDEDGADGGDIAPSRAFPSQRPPAGSIGGESRADRINKVAQALNWLSLAVQKLIRVYRIEEANALLDFMFKALDLTELSESPELGEQFSQLIRLRSTGELMELTGNNDEDAAIERIFEAREITTTDDYDLEDPYLELPPEGGKYRFVVQEHYRGMKNKGDSVKGTSVHLDWRMEANDHLLGFTLSDPKSGGLERRWTNVPGNNGDKVLAFTKSSQPLDWLTLSDIGEYWAPPGSIGATANTFGLFRNIDTGTVEFLATKPDFHEYYLNGKEFQGIFVVRKLKNIWGGRAGKEPFVWMSWKTKDQVPHVLSERAIKFKWLPPAGFSALPEVWRKKIPPELRWWAKKLTGSKGHEMRVKAVEFLKAKKELETELKAAVFTLHYRWWKGQTVIRGQRIEFWDLSIDNGEKQIQVWTLDGDPLFEPERTFNTAVTKISDKSWMNKKGEIKPGEFGNPNKKIAANLEIIDSGKATIIEQTANFISVNFKGKKLTGHWIFKRKPGEDLWEFEKGKLPGEDAIIASSDLVNKAASLKPFTLRAKLAKYIDGEVSYRKLTFIELRPKAGKYSMKKTSSKFQLPIEIEGTALEEGRHHGVWYPGPIVAASAPLLQFQRLQLEHGEMAKDVVGWVTKTWAENNLRIKFEALCYDKKCAEDILAGRKNAVSVGIWVKEKKTPNGREVTQIQKYDELTVTDSPECPTCKMQPK